MRVLHVSPHPDDELIGAPATLLALIESGHQIVNFACSLGRPEDAERRRLELEEACSRAGFALEISKHALELTSKQARGTSEVRESTESRLGAELDDLLSSEGFDLVVSPSPHDRHPTHELVGRAVRSTLERRSHPTRWWMWALWGNIPFPTTVVNFDGAQLEKILFALSAYAGEVARNDYTELVVGRGRSERVIAAELVFGFGSKGLPGPYVEATCEVMRSDTRWMLGAKRKLVAHEPFSPAPGPDVSWWLHSQSVTDRLAVPVEDEHSRIK